MIKVFKNLEEKRQNWIKDAKFQDIWNIEQQNIILEVENIQNEAQREKKEKKSVWEAHRKPSSNIGTGKSRKDRMGQRCSIWRDTTENFPELIEELSPQA